MSRRTTRVLKAVLSALHYSGADSMIAPFTRGIGAIFLLHHVSTEKPGRFEPNRIRRVVPQFLELVIRQVRQSGFEIVSLDEAHFRLIEGDYGKPFVCFTFDDGYRDNLEHAYPIFKQHRLPFAVYIPTDYADGRGDLWWLALEKVIGQVEALTLKMDGTLRRLRCGTPAEKEATFHAVYWWLRSIDEVDARDIVRELCDGIDFDADSLSTDLMMSWAEIRQLAADPLVTIGGHTRRHYALARLTLAEAQAEIEKSVRRIEQETGKPCRHFSYPYGDPASAGPREFKLVKELGLRTGVTTRNGLIHPRHALELTALPRISLNGDYQKPRYVKVLLSGAPFALLNMMPKASSSASPVT
jgi:peptidoglycan/xylan/chitin deacetylase (PgdA/CDA1 family)